MEKRCSGGGGGFCRCFFLCVSVFVFSVCMVCVGGLWWFLAFYCVLGIKLFTANIARYCYRRPRP